jgi:ubiquinone/menaquinone biosynthesis C-methylase UbiE
VSSDGQKGLDRNPRLRRIPQGGWHDEDGNPTSSRAQSNNPKQPTLPMTPSSPPLSHGEKEDAADTWAATANLYDKQAARLTERHGHDLVGLIEADLSKPNTTILEMGCGTGAFGQAYIQYFPHGVPGQTLILTDLSKSMLEKARTNLSPYLNKNEKEFATKIVIQEEDGTKLSGIDDDSIDIVVSLFGVFLIPDQDATFRSIRRVLRQKQAEFVC